jgi:hypothetical protein
MAKQEESKVESKLFIAFGDVHGDTRNISRISGISAADGVIITGDLTNRGTAEAARRVLDEIRRYNQRIIGQIGNMDTVSVQAELEGVGENIHLKARELAPGVGIMGIGHSTPTPFNTPSEVPESTMRQWLEETHRQARDFEELVLCIHTPPEGSEADRVGSGQHVGSPAVREFIERVQPAVCLTGHIHESVCSQLLGNTLVVNPGMLGAGGYVRLEIAGGAPRAELMSVDQD